MKNKKDALLPLTLKAKKQNIKKELAKLELASSALKAKTPNGLNWFGYM